MADFVATQAEAIKAKAKRFQLLQVVGRANEGCEDRNVAFQVRVLDVNVEMLETTQHMNCMGHFKRGSSLLGNVVVFCFLNGILVAFGHLHVPCLWVKILLVRTTRCSTCLGMSSSA